MAPKGDALAQDWQLECEGLRERAVKVLQEEQWTDCSFLVGLDEGVGSVELVKAHKLILAMASPVFQAMFYGRMAEGEDAIPIPDMQPDAFKAMLEYIYTDNYKITSDIMAIDIYYGAQKYMLPKLQKLCSQYLSSSLTPEIVCRVYEFSRMVGESKLTDGSMKMILSKAEDVFKSSSFLELSLDTVAEIFSWKLLDVKDELVLIRAADRYNQALEACRQDASTGQEAGDHMKTIKLLKQAMNGHGDGDTGHGQPAGETLDVKPATAAAGDMGYSTQDAKGENGEEFVSFFEVEDAKKEEVKDEVPDREILKVLREIRFLSLSTKQIAKERGLLSLLTRDEMLAILVNAANDDGDAILPMPEGFSTDRNARYEEKEKGCNDCGVNSAVYLWTPSTYDSSCLHGVCPKCNKDERYAEKQCIRCHEKSDRKLWTPSTHDASALFAVCPKCNKDERTLLMEYCKNCRGTRKVGENVTSYCYGGHRWELMALVKEICKDCRKMRKIGENVTTDVHRGHHWELVAPLQEKCKKCERTRKLGEYVSNFTCCHRWELVMN